MNTVIRETSETRVELGVKLEAGPIEVSGPDDFFNHMMTTLARYARMTLRLKVDGDLKHHRIEDVGITLGKMIARLTPSECARYGEASVVMDDAWVRGAIDLGGRFTYEGELPWNLYEHFLRSLAENAQMTCHLEVVRGRDEHHIVEAAYKTFGFCLSKAFCRSDEIFSTKGKVKWQWDGESI